MFQIIKNQRRKVDLGNHLGQAFFLIPEETEPKLTWPSRAPQCFPVICSSPPGKAENDSQMIVLL